MYAGKPSTSGGGRSTSKAGTRPAVLALAGYISSCAAPPPHICVHLRTPSHTQYRVIQRAISDVQRRDPVDTCEDTPPHVVVMGWEPVCGRAPACTTRSTRDLVAWTYVIRIDPTRVDFEDALYHEALHIALWESGLAPGPSGMYHHEWMRTHYLW